eukprot:6988028-Ditylum_brightwellii.AAC.1
MDSDWVKVDDEDIIYVSQQSVPSSHPRIQHKNQHEDQQVSMAPPLEASALALSRSRGEDAVLNILSGRCHDYQNTGSNCNNDYGSSDDSMLNKYGSSNNNVSTSGSEDGIAIPPKNNTRQEKQKNNFDHKPCECATVLVYKQI